MTTLNDLRDLAFQNSKEKGFHDEPKSVGDYLALIHSEVSEALEDHRDGHTPTEVWYEIPKGFRDAGQKIPFDHLQVIDDSESTVLTKPCGIPSEMADIIIRVLDFCGAHKIDIEKAVREKMAFNATRPRKHGRKVI